MRILERVEQLIQEMHKPKHEEIAKLAYTMWVKDGCVHGKDVTHWLLAEKLIESFDRLGYGSSHGSPYGSYGTGSILGGQNCKACSDSDRNDQEQDLW